MQVRVSDENVGHDSNNQTRLTGIVAVVLNGLRQDVNSLLLGHGLDLVDDVLNITRRRNIIILSLLSVKSRDSLLHLRGYSGLLLQRIRLGRDDWLNLIYSHGLGHPSVTASRGLLITDIVVIVGHVGSFTASGYKVPARGARHITTAQTRATARETWGSITSL
jgi:hypothetical protein